MFENLLSQGNFFTTYFSGTATLFVAAFTSIISVLAAIPVFLSLTERNSDSERIGITQK